MTQVRRFIAGVLYALAAWIEPALDTVLDDDIAALDFEPELDDPNFVPSIVRIAEQVTDDALNAKALSFGRFVEEHQLNEGEASTLLDAVNRRLVKDGLGDYETASPIDFIDAVLDEYDARLARRARRAELRTTKTVTPISTPKVA